MLFTMHVSIPQFKARGTSLSECLAGRPGREAALPQQRQTATPKGSCIERFPILAKNATVCAFYRILRRVG